MAQEQIIKNKVKLQLAEEGYVFWSGAKAMYQSSDIFGIFDCIAVKKGETNQFRFIQYTSISNMSARRRKMKLFFETHNLFITSELWGYDRGRFVVQQFFNRESM